MIGIDPGTTQSAIVDIHPNGSIKAHAWLPNTELEKQLRFAHDDVAIEMVASYGMAVGQDIFDTCVWIGRFVSAAKSAHVGVYLVFREDVKIFLCHSKQAKDANVRQALIDRYGAGSEKKGKKCPRCKGSGEVSIRKSVMKMQCPRCHGGVWVERPGPLAGVRKHEWAALAVAMTAQGNPGCLVTPIE